jgi:hypothetical protein
VFIPLKIEKPDVHRERLSMKLYVDADLKVMKKSNDEALQESRLRSCTHVRCIDALRALVQRSSRSSRSGPMSQQHDDVPEGERCQRPMNRMREEPQGALYIGDGEEGVGLPRAAATPS